MEPLISNIVHLHCAKIWYLRTNNFICISKIDTVWYDISDQGSNNMFFPSRMFGVDGLMADKCLLCLLNFLSLQFLFQRRLENRKNTHSLHSLMSFSLILSVLPLLLQTPQWLKLWLMGWFRAEDTRQGRTLSHRVDTIRFELQEVVSSVTQLVWEPEFCRSTWCSVLCARRSGHLGEMACGDAVVMLTGDGGFLSLEIDDVISGGVLLLA